MESITVEHISSLYAKYQDDLRVVRDAQRKFLKDRGKSMKAQLDDYEAEMTYLLLRDLRPEIVVEVGTFYGWSTMWILSALRDNGSGHLHSFDIVDNVVRNVPVNSPRIAGRSPRVTSSSTRRRSPPRRTTSSSTRTTAPGLPTGTSRTCSRPSRRARPPASTTSSTAGAPSRSAKVRSS